MNPARRYLFTNTWKREACPLYIKEKSSSPLSWQQRLGICLDAARGLQHLHAETHEFPKGIIHRDVKPENILLDKNWVAKISDFGMFKLSHVGQLQSTMTTNLKGTRGYYAPEYIAYRTVTKKIDVYAFGVVLFQVLCLKMPWDRGDESYYSMDDEDLGIWAQQNVDTKIKEEICPDSLKAFTAIIGKSLQRDPKKRPTMAGVVLDLEILLTYQMREDDTKSVMASSTSSSQKCRQISLDEIKDATANFDERNVLGHGGEGKVYLAEIRLGGIMTQVAVKHLKSNSEEFEKEIKTISKIQHPNLLSLLGYCDESGQKILVYQYMEKGSLSSYLKKNSSFTLSWQQRLGICPDAARGLQHLHAETDEFPKGIIHCDVKPHVILLDKNWVAKISDFGLIKVSHVDQQQPTIIKGTTGYFAPETIAYRSVTRKIDVYAFGVVLFQVLCLKRPWDRGDESYYSMDDEDLGIWAQQKVDTKIKEEICPDSLKAFTAIIGKSMQRDPKKRPTMAGVVLDLENSLKYQMREDDLCTTTAKVALTTTVP